MQRRLDLYSRETRARSCIRASGRSRPGARSDQACSAGTDGWTCLGWRRPARWRCRGRTARAAMPATSR